jgi:hypothetical protein
VNQATGNMEAETQEPQNENDYKDCPKHSYSFTVLRAHGNCKLTQAPASIGN